MEKTCVECSKVIKPTQGRYCYPCYYNREKAGLTGIKSVNDNNEKQCTICEIWKDISEFTKWRRQCKPCQKKYEADKTRERRDEINARRRLTRSAYDKKVKEERPEVKIVSNYRIRIWQIVKQPRNKSSTKLLGCDRDTFLAWLQFNFDDGMTFQNYGKHWHMDHIIPCAAFDINDPSQLEQCFHWSNLAPLERIPNLSKSDKICHEDIRYYRQRAREFIKLKSNKDKGLSLLELTVPNLSSDIRAA